jgi:adenosylhomocysteine nucleosidase
MSDVRLAALVERAFDYRGYVTLKRHDGSELVGFVFDRGTDRGAEYLQILDESATKRTLVPLKEVADIAFTGEDTAEKSVRIWEKRKGTLEPGSTSAWGDWDEEKPALILVALEQELRVVAKAMGAQVRQGAARGRLNGGAAVAIAVGLGGGARKHVEAEKPRAVLSCGFSGALTSALSAGDLVLSSSVRDETGEILPASESLRKASRTAFEGLRFVEGELVCATRVAATPAEKQALAGGSGLAVDLESWAAASAAREAGIPWIGLRVILDPLESELPAFTREAHQSYVAPALRHALRGPRAVASLARLASQARTASLALEQALKRIGPALAAAGRKEQRV